MRREAVDNRSSREYPLERHKEELAKFQDFLDQILAILDGLGMEQVQMGKMNRVAFVGADGEVKFYVDETHPIAAANFLLVRDSELENRWISIQYGFDDDKVSDSAQFDGSTYLGTGHIQADGLSYIDLVNKLIAEGGEWKILAQDDSYDVASAAKYQPISAVDENPVFSTEIPAFLDKDKIEYSPEDQAYALLRNGISQRLIDQASGADVGIAIVAMRTILRIISEKMNRSEISQRDSAIISSIILTLTEFLMIRDEF